MIGLQTCPKSSLLALPGLGGAIPPAQPVSGLQALISEADLTLREVAAEVGFSKSVIQRLVANGEWPRRGVERLYSELWRLLTQRGVKASQLLLALTPKQIGPGVQQHAEAAPEVDPATPEEESMLLQCQALSPQARQHFELPRSPFVDDVQTPDDVFQTPSVRYVRAALMDCARHHGFMAVVGESGAGKSTLAEDLEERIKASAQEIVVIRPYVLAMEQSDAKGKTLKSSHIAEAIAAALDPQLKVKSSPEARFAQVHALLKASRKGGCRHLLVIEEAHCLPTATLKHLKRFLELKDGMQRLIGVALIAQPELRERLNSQNAEVREVMQRCEIVELEPLDAELEGYLRHKFARFDLKFEDVFEADAVDAIRARLVHTPRGGRAADTRSICYPLVVNNLVARAMNAAAAASWPKVDAQVIAGC
ncbi:type II secretory pathway predicted ATPase ExeA [Inhella inkyongensis]|uniref:Type II secretory pathway predicted ATPase ExeA n=1 Tax=Inhella inkyongensis TaxID=392593 RepID=A0A840S7J4_9BURK|nr:AAA family ATPase [Inhella inkyongensis]MBB5204419.1 type II secretory pathway predicted ATPase ExeA [Inhella inkyongensis]